MAPKRTKNILPADFEPRRSTRPRKVVNTKGTCGAPATRIKLGDTVPATQTTVMTSSPPTAVHATQHSFIKFREEAGMENYVEVTIRGKIMENETVSIAQTSFI